MVRRLIESIYGRHKSCAGLMLLLILASFVVSRRWRLAAEEPNMFDK